MAHNLVTGGAGFIGSHLVEALVSTGQRVRVLDDFSTGKVQNLQRVRNQVDLVEGSILNLETVQAAVQGIDFVFHLAALPSVQRSIEDPIATHAVCATGTLHILHAAVKARVRRVIYAASSSAYGGCPGKVRTEQDSLSPLSPYAAAKLAGEQYCQSFTTSFGLETVRLRFFNIFGPRQDSSSPYSGVIPLFIRAMSKGDQPIVHGDGLQSRDFTHVDNAVQALLRAAESPMAVGQVHNIGTGENTSLLGLIRHLNSILGTDIQPVHGPIRQGDVRQSTADISKARKELQYEPTISFLEGLRNTVKAFQAEHDPTFAG
jgi:UDP-glucose 4-epimerase